MSSHSVLEIRKTFSPVTVVVLSELVYCFDIKRLCETS